MSLVKVPSVDFVTSVFASMPGFNQRASNSSLSSIGYKLKLQAKDAVKANSFGWPDITNLTAITKKFPAMEADQRTWWMGLKKNSNLNSATYENAWRQINGFTSKTWGSLSGLLVYSLEKETGGLMFGFKAGVFGKRYGYFRQGAGVNGHWGGGARGKVRVENVIGDTAVGLAEKLTTGFSHTITSTAQQRYYAALGFIFRKGTTIKCPARPLVGPTFLVARPKIPAWFRDKFWERMRIYSVSDPILKRLAK